MRYILPLLGLVLASAAEAQIVVEQPWSRATAPSAQNGAAFMTVVNKSATTADRMVSAETPSAQTVELHNHIMDGNVMKMRKVEGIDVKPGETVVLQPMGLHVMMFGLKGPLQDGGSFPLTLVFEKAGRIEVNVAVGKPGASGMGMGGGMGGGHQHMQHMQHGQPKTH